MDAAPEGLRVDEIVAVLASGADRLLNSDGTVSHLDHALQTAALLARDYPGDPELIAAGLVHDLGHLLPGGSDEGHAAGWPATAWTRWGGRAVRCRRRRQTRSSGSSRRVTRWCFGGLTTGRRRTAWWWTGSTAGYISCDNWRGRRFHRVVAPRESWRALAEAAGPSALRAGDCRRPTVTRSSARRHGASGALRLVGSFRLASRRRSGSPTSS